MRAEKRFRLYGRGALMLAVALLALLLGIIVARGYQGFSQTAVRLPVAFDMAVLGHAAGVDTAQIPASSFNRLAQQALEARFPDAVDRREKRMLHRLVSNGAGIFLKRMVLADPSLAGSTREVWLPMASEADLYVKGRISKDTPEGDRRFADRQMAWVDMLAAEGRVERRFNATFFSGGDSRTPERAGFLGAIMGSLLTLGMCLLIVFPLGVATAVYLEEFARKGLLVDIIEVNINNLAAVPSIVFGLLGLAVYINIMGMPRSSALVGGITLALMVLPVVIIATRAALKSIPSSIRDAARALGASPLQVVWHHTLPLAMPGIMTGTILSMARAIGETAPLLMIGMVAFVADVPMAFSDPATAMPVQIYLWASSPEAGFAEKTSAGILVLLVILLAMNALAIMLRKKMEVRW